MKPSMYIFTLVFGDTYIDWMHRALVRSLSWPKNKAALKDARWIIFTPPENQQRIYEIATQVLPFHQIERQDLMWYSPTSIYHLGCMMKVMQKCLLDKIPMLTAPPDTIFSEGSIDTLMAYGTQRDTCVAVPHPRVSSDIMSDLTSTPPTNAELVSLALKKHTHKAWTSSNKKLDVSACFRGGIAWEQIDENLTAVQHRIPTVYYSNFNDNDRKFFSGKHDGQSIQYGEWDWKWPATHVIPQQRMRLIGSSDAAFICEMTQPWSNVPTPNLTNRHQPDAFFQDDYHCKINRQYVSVWRGE